MSEGAVLPSKAWNRSKHQHSYHQKKRHSNKDPKKKINVVPASQPQPNEPEVVVDADAEEQDEDDQQKAKMEQTIVELPSESEFEDRPYTLQELIDASRESSDGTTKGIRLRADKEWDSQLNEIENGGVTSFDGEFLAVQFSGISLAKRLFLLDSNTTSPLLIDSLAQLEVKSKQEGQLSTPYGNDLNPSNSVASSVVMGKKEEEEDKLLDELLAL